jgi:hypothetical protein
LLSEIPLSLSSINAVLTTKMENDTSFDARKMLGQVDHELQLQPDLQFFNNLFWQCAKMGDLEEFMYVC